MLWDDCICIGWHGALTLEEEDDVVWDKEELGGAERDEVEEEHELDSGEAF